MNAFTINNILSWGPCIPPYTSTYLKKLFAGQETINEYDVVNMPIPAKDKGWGLGRMLPWGKDFRFPAGVKHLWVEDNPNLTEFTVPEEVEYLRVENNGF